jgi:hypothetical protein
MHGLSGDMKRSMKLLTGPGWRLSDKNFGEFRRDYSQPIFQSEVCPVEVLMLPTKSNIRDRKGVATKLDTGHLRNTNASSSMN